MYVVAVPGFVHAVPASIIAEPAYFEHYASETASEWPSGLCCDSAAELPHPEAAFHLSGVRAYLDWGAL